MRTSGTIGKIFAVIFTIPFIILVMLSAVLIQAEKILLTPGSYKEIFESEDLYDRLPRILAEQLVYTYNYDPCTENPLTCEAASPEFLNCATTALGSDRFSALSTGQSSFTTPDWTAIRPCLSQYPLSNEQQSEGPPEFLKILTISDWEAIFSSLIPPDDLKLMAEKTLDQFLGYLNGTQNVVSLSLDALRSRLEGPEGLAALEGILRAQPDCSVEQIAELLIKIGAGDPEFTLCNPPAEVLTMVSPLLQAQLAILTEQLPPEVIILDRAIPGSTNPASQAGLRTILLIIRLSPVLPMAILLLITLFAVRSLRSWLAWWGMPLFLSGLATLIMGMTSGSLFENLWVQEIGPRIPTGINLGLLALIHDLLSALAHRVSESIVIIALLIAFFGILLWVGSRFIRDKRSPT